MAEPQKSQGLTGQVHALEIRAAFAGSAVYSNRFVVTTNSAGVRIGFMEDDGTGGVMHHRTSVLLSYQDAIALRNLLSTMLLPVELQMEAQKPPSNG